MDNNVVNNFVKVTQEHKHVVVKGAGGLRGVQGPAGAGLQISGSVATYADLPWQLTIYDAGKAYFVQADGLLYVWTGERWPNEGDGAEFVGPQGEPGYSPQATVTKVGDTATITITDRDGTTTATVSDGTTPVIDDSLSLVSENPVQNKVVTSAINGKQATLQAGDITTSLLADESVTEAKLTDGSVTTSKIGSQSVTEGIIADGAVTTDKLGSAAVTSSKIDWTTMSGVDVFSAITPSRGTFADGSYVAKGYDGYYDVHFTFSCTTTVNANNPCATFDTTTMPLATDTIVVGAAPWYNSGTVCIWRFTTGGDIYAWQPGNSTFPNGTRLDLVARFKYS